MRGWPWDLISTFRPPPGAYPRNLLKVSGVSPQNGNGRKAMLFACLFVPCFAVQASVRCEPEQKRLAWSNRPIAVFDGPDSLPRVFACNEQAQIAGIDTGKTLLFRF